MQTLWSRVAQVPNCCRCPQCLSSVQSISRRAATTAPRRIPYFFTTSTFVYTSIFAAAATFDAGKKQERKEQWERALADVKQEVTSADAKKVYRPFETEEGAEEVSLRANVLDGIEPGVQLDDGLEEDPFRLIDCRGPKPLWPSNTGPPLEVYNLPPQSIYADDVVKARAENRQWTPKKIAAAGVSMDIMQIKIFLLLEELGWSKEAADAVPQDFARHLLLPRHTLLHRRDSLKSLMSVIRKSKSDLAGFDPTKLEATRLCRFTHDEAGDFVQVVKSLNESLIAEFRTHADKQISTSQLYSRLMYNISTSCAPPDVNTYNILLQGLSRTGHNPAVYATIRALREACIRPNEVTLAAILKFYTDANKPEEFIRWVELMRGHHAGLSLARPDIDVTDAGRSRLTPRPDQPSKIIQLPYPTPNVFAALVAGVVKFGGFDKTIRIMDGMGNEGWGLCMSGLAPLLDDCATRKDWRAGMAIWNQIQALKWNSRRETGGRWISERVPLPTFAAMLRLCSRCDKRSVYEDVWHKAAREHRTAGPRLMQMIQLRKAKAPAAETFGDRAGQMMKSRSIDTQTRGKVADRAGQVVISHLDGTQVAADSQSLPVVQMQMGQLDGTLPGGSELDEYELRERPMELRA